MPFFFYNLINSALAAQWVNSLPSTNCVRAAVAPDRIRMLRNGRNDNARSTHNGIFMLCTNKTKMTVLGWPKTTRPAPIPQSVLSHRAAFQAPPSGAHGCLFWQRDIRFTCDQQDGPTPFFCVWVFISWLNKCNINTNKFQLKPTISLFSKWESKRINSANDKIIKRGHFLVFHSFWGGGS